MSVHVVADSPVKLSALCRMLEPQYAVTSELLSGATRTRSAFDAVVVTADLRIVENIAALREMFETLGHVRKRIFLIDQKARLFTVQAYALGATRVLTNPVAQGKLLAELSDSSRSETAPTDTSHAAHEAASAGAVAI